jgi:hypothetical protein
MINYFIRSNGAYIKIDTTTKTVDIVLNATNQKTLSLFTDNINFYNTSVSASVYWTTTDQTTFDNNKTIVLQAINN